MNRRERLMTTLEGKPVDRPAVNFYGIGGYIIDPSNPDELNIYNSPSWKPLVQLAEEQTDIIRMVSPVRARSHESWDMHWPSPAKSCRDEFFTVKDYLEDGSQFTHITLKIAGRTLTSLMRRAPDVDTLWTLEPLLKGTDDIKAFLELPDEAFAEELDIESMVEEEKKLGDRGIVMVDTEDPIAAAQSLMAAEDFIIIAYTEQKLIHSLLEKLARYIQVRTEKTAKQFPGRLWRIYGPEVVSEPFLPPNLFEEYVVRYTGPMVEAIQKYGGYARIHIHGKMRSVIDHIIGMGAVAIDPVEPPPQGDMELAEVRRLYGKDLVLFGNLETSDIENVEPDKFVKIVEKSLIDGTSGQGRGFVLMPSACPHGREITPRVMANYETIVRLVNNFG